jgi:hypothetical protein
MPVKINGATNGSVTLAAPDTGSDVTVTLPATAGTVATQAYADTAGATLGGLVHIATESFSAVSAVNINDCFTSTYANYKIMCTITAASVDNQNVSFRYRASGTDNSSANYSTGGVLGISSNVSEAVYQLNGTSHTQMTNTTTTANRSVGFTMDVISPQLAAITAGIVNGIGFTSVTFGRFFVTTHNVASAFDGFSFFANTGTITGTVRVYGYLNS